MFSSACTLSVSSVLSRSLSASTTCRRMGALASAGCEMELGETVSGATACPVIGMMYYLECMSQTFESFKANNAAISKHLVNWVCVESRMRSSSLSKVSGIAPPSWPKAYVFNSTLTFVGLEANQTVRYDQFYSYSTSRFADSRTSYHGVTRQYLKGNHLIVSNSSRSCVMGDDYTYSFSANPLDLWLNNQGWTGSFIFVEKTVYGNVNVNHWILKREGTTTSLHYYDDMYKLVPIAIEYRVGDDTWEVQDFLDFWIGEPDENDWTSIASHCR